ncbi:MAG TPA: hypothetical protein VI094_08425 [Propionibacteriaceae bacterium]
MHPEKRDAWERLYGERGEWATPWSVTLDGSDLIIGAYRFSLVDGWDEIVMADDISLAELERYLSNVLDELAQIEAGERSGL